MAIVRWSPFNQLYSVNQMLNRMFDESFLDDKTMMPSAREMAINMRETKEGYVVETPLPGINPEEVEIHVADNLLTIKADRKEEREREAGDYLMRECYSGSYYRQISIPANVASDQIEASSSHGVLKLILPKKPELKPKKIAIKVDAKNTKPKELSK